MITKKKIIKLLAAITSTVLLCTSISLISAVAGSEVDTEIQTSTTEIQTSTEAFITETVGKQDEAVLVNITPDFYYEKHEYDGILYSTAKLISIRLWFSDKTVFDVDSRYFDKINFPVDDLPTSDIGLLKDGSCYLIAIEGTPGRTEINSWPTELKTIYSSTMTCYVNNITNINEYSDKIAKMELEKPFSYYNSTDGTNIRNEYEPEELIKHSGDANGDGEYTVADLVILQEFLLGKKSNMQNWVAIDFTSDGVINAFDMVLARRRLVEQYNLGQ